MKKPLVSVVIPTHGACWKPGRGKIYFIAALNSVLSQSFKDYEVVVVYPPHVRRAGQRVGKDLRARVRFIPSHGSTIGAARNAGMKAVKGTWVAFLDSDDLWFPNKLMSQMVYIHDHPGCDLIHSDAIVFSRKKNEFMSERLSEMRRPIRGRLTPKNVNRHGFFLLTSSLMMKKHIWEKTGSFNESLWAYEDDEFLFRASSGAPYVGYIADPLVLFRIKKEGQNNRFLRQKAKKSLDTGAWRD